MRECHSFFSTEEEGEAEMSDLKNQDGCSKMVDREENSELESVKDSKLQVCPETKSNKVFLFFF